MCTDQDNPICFGGSWSLPDGREGEFYADYPDREITQMLEDMVAELDMSVESNSFVQEAIIESGVNALIGTITVEECINEIEKATALYLAE